MIPVLTKQEQSDTAISNHAEYVWPFYGFGSYLDGYTTLTMFVWVSSGKKSILKSEFFTNLLKR